MNVTTVVSASYFEVLGGTRIEGIGVTSGCGCKWEDLNFRRLTVEEFESLGTKLQKRQRR